MDVSNQVDKVWGWFCCGIYFFSCLPGKTLMRQNKGVIF